MKLESGRATECDVPQLVELPADDALGSRKEDSSVPLDRACLEAFHRIERGPGNELTVVECEGELVGMRCYESIGFRATHEGLELPIPSR